MPKIRLPLLLALLALATAVAAAIAVARPASAAETDEQPAPCATEDHRRFDFWTGTWEVHRWGAERSKQPAENRITPILDGCALHEDYANRGGYRGQSLSFYDAAAGRWHQTWIANDGQALYLEGGWSDGRMVLEDDRGNRITWTPQADGSVRQTWERTAAGGDGEPQVVFDGHYVPAGD